MASSPTWPYPRCWPRDVRTGTFACSEEDMEILSMFRALLRAEVPVPVSFRNSCRAFIEG